MRCPSVLMSVTAGVGWFATNSVSGAFALSTLFGIGPLLALVLIVLIQTALAFFGHNLVQAFETLVVPGAGGDLRDRLGGDPDQVALRRARPSRAASAGWAASC